MSKVTRIFVFVRVNLLVIAAGSTFSWSSPIGPKLSNATTTPFEQPVTLEEVSWISSVLNLGAAIGPYIFGFMATRIGEKKTLLIIAIPLLGSHLAMALGKSVVVFYISRFFIGIGVGGIFSTGLNYVAEMSNRNRGLFMGMFSVFVGVGILYSYSVGPYVSIMLQNLLITIIVGVFMVVFLIFGDDTPRYLLNQQKDDEARKVLQHIVGPINVEKEITELKTKKDENSKGNFSEIFKSKGLTKVFFVTGALFILQQASGVNLVYYYSQTIFEEAGTALTPELCSIVLGVDQLISSVVMAFIINLYGRKITLMISCIIVSLSILALGFYDYLQIHNIEVTYLSYIPVISLTFFIFGYHAGIGPIPWLVLAEVFPPKNKNTATAVISSFNWILSFIITKYIGFFLYTLGLSWSCWLFSACCFFFIFFVKVFVIETKNKSLEEIQDMINK